MNIGVYCIKNIINNKVYVGSTIRSFSKRFGEHKRLLKLNMHMYCNDYKEME